MRNHHRDVPEAVITDRSHGRSELSGPPGKSSIPLRHEAAQGRQPVRGAATAFTDIVSVTAARGGSIALGLLVASITTHLLHPAQYAILAYILVISGLMVTATASWTATSVVRYGREELERSGSIRATSWGRLVITTPLVALAISVIVLLKVARVLPSIMTWEFVGIAVATGLAGLALEHFTNLLEASGRMKLTAVAVTVQRIAQVAGLVALIALGVARSAAAIALMLLLVASLLSAALASTVWRLGVWPVTLDRALFRRMVTFSLPMIAFSVSQYIIQAVDVVILGAYRPSRDVGLYAIAYQGYGVLMAIATTATIVLSPLFVSLRVASREHLIERYYERTVSQVVILISVGAGLVAPMLSLVVPLVFGKAFGLAAMPLTILLLAWILYAAESFVAPILVLHERSRAMGAISSLAAIVNVVGDWLLVGVFGVGIVGPAVATVVSLAVIMVGYFQVAANSIGHSRVLPVAMIAPAVVGVGLALAVHGALGVAAAVAGTLVTAAIIFVRHRPFAAEDIDMIGKLDIPGPFKQLTLRVLARLG